MKWLSCTAEWTIDRMQPQAIKSLPPWQRAWDPATRTWPVEVLALPELLEALAPLCTVRPRPGGVVKRP